MNPETGVYELLSTNAALVAEVGAKIYPGNAPQNVAAPFIVYTQLDEKEQFTQDGPVSDGWSFQVSIIATNNLQARVVSRLVKTALNWKTVVLDSGETIRTRFDDESDASFQEEQKYFQIVQDFLARKT
jgi:hypothetical protein